MRIITLFVFAGSVISLIGCGPMDSSPMPPRFEADAQKKIDDTWENAVNPPEKLDRQALLDAVIWTHAYQAGVDRLLFRSEKDFSGGIVVMEIHFDRSKPNDDRFEIKILDKEQKLVRELTYNRAEIEKAHKELHNPKNSNVRGPNDPPLAPDEVKKREEVQKRIAAVEALFPKQEDAK